MGAVIRVKRVPSCGIGETIYVQKSYVQTCEECQRRNSSSLGKALHPTWVTLLWQKVGLDVVYMPPCEGYQFLVVAPCDLSGWVEAKLLDRSLRRFSHPLGDARLLPHLQAFCCVPTGCFENPSVS